MQTTINNFPHIYLDEKEAEKLKLQKKVIYSLLSKINPERIKSSFGIALHMHQPIIPASTNHLSKAALISNLEYMMKNQHIGDNHNAPVFLSCYGRMSDFIRELVDEGKSPRIMLDYSGNLLWGLSLMGEDKVLDNLRLITCEKKYYPYVEWLGTMWSHAVVPSTPVPDIELHLRAWQGHFASIFGYQALSKVKGFSPPEMHLPIHPDVCYDYIKTLKKCGYEWILVQEHTIENLDGSAIRRRHFPHRLVAKNSLGKIEEITALIKSQGSDTKLVGQMQPYYEAQSLERQEYAGKKIPAYVLQISDGENGGVMMNEFPPKYKSVMREISPEGVVMLNGSEYLELIKRSGFEKEDFLTVQPIGQQRIWEFIDRFGPGQADKAIEKAKAKYGGFNLDKGSWTNDKNWVKGYENVLDPINRLSVEFHRRFDNEKKNDKDPAYLEALVYLLLSQTSCFRYWGSGIWTDYAKEICRRGMQAITGYEK
jgi:hypothetical protein